MAGGSSRARTCTTFRAFTRDDDLHRYFWDADLVVADGMPLLWASRLQGTPLPERVAGRTSSWTLSAAAAANRLPVYLIGGNPGAAQSAANRLQGANPGLCVVGVDGAPTGFDRDAASLLAFARDICDSGARIVFVGLPFPRQERTIACLRAEVGSAWFVGVGVSFSFVSGELKRAPRVMQLTGLESGRTASGRSRAGSDAATSSKASRSPSSCSYRPSSLASRRAPVRGRREAPGPAAGRRLETPIAGRQRELARALDGRCFVLYPPRRLPRWVTPVRTSSHRCSPSWCCSATVPGPSW